MKEGGEDLKYELLDILACPIDKSYPLKLFVLSEERREVKTKDGVVSWVEVVDGVLACPSCGRWYPIIDEIPELLPDELRDRDREIKFLEKHARKLPEEIVRKGLPFNLG